MRVFITGGTGLVGSRLIQRLRERRDSIVLLTRRPDAAREHFHDCTIVSGDPTLPGAWQQRVSECDAVINLAGEPVFGRRWNAVVKELLYDSRVGSARNIVAALHQETVATAGSPKALVNASAIGFYGARGDEMLNESSAPGDDFLARLTVAWENEAHAAESAGVRVAMIRIGVVLDPRGGALSKMLTPFKLGLGGPIASGKQWISWIHYHDLVGILLLALDNAAARGPLNGTAPNPVTNKEFSRALGRALHRPAFFPVPGFALRLRFGEVAEVLTTGQRVLPERSQELGYSFRFPEIDSALRDLFGS